MSHTAVRNIHAHEGRLIGNIMAHEIVHAHKGNRPIVTTWVTAFVRTRATPPVTTTPQMKRSGNNTNRNETHENLFGRATAQYQRHGARNVQAHEGNKPIAATGQEENRAVTCFLDMHEVVPLETIERLRTTVVIPRGVRERQGAQRRSSARWQPPRSNSMAQGSAGHSPKKQSWRMTTFMRPTAAAK